MKILLLGASSYVGARIFYDLKKSHEVIGTYDHTHLSSSFRQLDITQSEKVKQLINKVKPRVIIHAANNANGRWCEANPELAKALNEVSTQTVVEAANSVNAKLIYISSFAAVNPTSVYGKTKQASEIYTKQTNGGWVIIRPSLIIGYSPNTKNDRPFNRILKNLDEGTKAEYDSSWKFQPTWLHHISEVLESVLQGEVNKEVIPVAADKLVSRYDVAKDILQTFGVEVSAIDTHDASPIFQENLEILRQLDLPSYSYEDMILNIVQEIRHRETFELT